MVSDARLAELKRTTANRTGDEVLELALAYDERHDPNAADTYRSAAAMGIGAAELRLGALYEVGEGVQQSYEQARKHYELAVGLGVAEANLRLGLLFLEGWGVPRDVPTALSHVERAAEAGYKPAQTVLSEMFFSGTGVAADPKKALEWAERAADTGSADAQARAGYVQQAATRLPQDIKAAREWFQLSAEQDYSRGMLAMASTFFRPDTDQATRAVGLRWLDLAAEAGNAAAAFLRAGCILMVDPATLNPDATTRARALLRRSADLGEPPAAEVLELEKSGRPLTDAFRYVVTVPYDTRYVQRTAAVFAAKKGSNVPPFPIKVVRPIYPAAMRLTQTEGEALIEFVVDKTGRVRDARVVSASHPAFAEPSAAATRLWVFTPATVNGRLGNTRLRVPIFFQMSDLKAGPGGNGP
jgi:TonB family protein